MNAGQDTGIYHSRDAENDAIEFHTTDNKQYRMSHDQDCCESVTIEDVCGEWENIIGSPLVMVEERTHSAKDDEVDSYTWTFYLLATVKGSVTLRWYGTSNGYYSESVTLMEIAPHLLS